MSQGCPHNGAFSRHSCTWTDTAQCIWHQQHYMSVLQMVLLQHKQRHHLVRLPLSCSAVADNDLECLAGLAHYPDDTVRCHQPLQIADYLTKPQQLMAAQNTESSFLQQFYKGAHGHILASRCCRLLIQMLFLFQLSGANRCCLSRV